MERVARKGIMLRRGAGQVSVVLSKAGGRGYGWSALVRDVIQRVRMALPGTLPRFDASGSKRGKESWGLVMTVVIVSMLFLWTVYDVRSERQLDVSRILPYPLDIAKEVRVPEGLNWTSGENSGTHRYFAGYVEVRPGTFRDVDTSREDRGRPNRYGTFDEVFVVTNEKCSAQMGEFSERAASINLKYTKIVISLKNVSLDHPNMPIRTNTSIHVMNAAQRVALKQNLAYTLAHRETWRLAKQKRRQRILVIDDSLFLKDRLTSVLPELFSWVDQESVAGSNPWHLMFFRRKILEEDWTAQNESIWEGTEGTWSSNPSYGHPVVRAKPSYGAGAYALSLQGANWLVDHVTEYRAPLDVEISMLQKEYPHDFVALSACNNDKPRTFCPENVEEIISRELSGSNDCVWRRVQERKVSSLVDVDRGT